METTRLDELSRGGGTRRGEREGAVIGIGTFFPNIVSFSNPFDISSFFTIRYFNIFNPFDISLFLPIRYLTFKNAFDIFRYFSNKKVEFFWRVYLS